MAVVRFVIEHGGTGRSENGVDAGTATNAMPDRCKYTVDPGTPPSERTGRILGVRKKKPGPLQYGVVKRTWIDTERWCLAPAPASFGGDA